MNGSEVAASLDNKMPRCVVRTALNRHLRAGVAVVAFVTLLMTGAGHAFSADIAADPSSQSALDNQADALKENNFSMVDALMLAYQTNPDLLAAQAELRAVDESYAQAFSEFRPNISAEASYNSTLQKSKTLQRTIDTQNYGVNLSQSIYAGGASLARMDQSTNNIKAQRAVLKRIEQDVMLRGITAYLNVVRDNEIVKLNKQNEDALQKRLEESQQRFELGDLTKTDVSQSESRLAAATAARVLAENNYKLSRAVFEAVIGVSPEGVSQPAVNVQIPATLDEAIAFAEKNNPQVQAATHASVAAGYAKRAVEGELLPRVDLTTGIAEVYGAFLGAGDHQTQSAFGIVATVPLYTSGAVDSRVRQAKQVEAQRRNDIDRTVRAVRQGVIDAWTTLQSAESEIKARKIQLDSANLALEGVKAETEYGSRTTLDVLDAQREVLDAHVAHVSAERNKIVAVYSLLAAIGELTAQHLQLNVPYYDPDFNFQKVKGKWIGTGIEPLDGSRKQGVTANP